MGESKSVRIGKTRRRIDEIDDQLLDLLEERMDLSRQIGEDKKRRGLPLYVPEREGAILERLAGRDAERGGGQMGRAAVIGVWREIFSASRQTQSPIKVAYLGPNGTFTHQAALTRFGSSAGMIASQTIASAFALIQNGTVDFAVLPVENTLHGIVGETVDLLGTAGQPLIADEIVMPIHFVFSSGLDDLGRIERVYSKPEAFLQCANFLNQPALEKAERIASPSTAEAARQAAADPAGASLSPEIAANLAGIPIRFRHVENNADNKTRFFVLGHVRPDRTGDDKTSVFAKVQNVAGGLEALLRSFSDRRINLTKIESRPMDESVNFETWFYIDLDGHAEDAGIRDIIASHGLVWLGSYPRPRRPEGGR
ncbi:MAG: chorismate mutase [Planctomycetota bacterium]|jgi:chorismate mutase/prephenate dehydratase|nr:chorismate mutase [Planctomycetota bacterium]